MHIDVDHMLALISYYITGFTIHVDMAISIREYEGHYVC